MNRLSKVKIEWSPDFAYAIGLIATDGNLSKDGRHLNFTSKDYELVVIFKKCLNLDNKIGRKARGGSLEKKYFMVQFGDRNFYDFLVNLGLKVAKSKILESLDIPSKYFADFFRGCIDGDGCITSHKHPESKYLQWRLKLSSASPKFLYWAKQQIKESYNVQGGFVRHTPNNRAYELTYGKRDAEKILTIVYYPGVKYYLRRKFLKAKNLWASGGTGRRTGFRSQREQSHEGSTPSSPTK